MIIFFRIVSFIKQIYSVFCFLARDKAGQSFKKRACISFVYFKLTLKDLICRVLHKNLTDENFLGYKINFKNYSAFRTLFVEIFILQEYAFKTDRNPLIVDCGSNIGMSVMFFKYCFPKAKIIAFEPDACNFEILKKNVRQNRILNVSLHNCALSDKIGRIDFYVDNFNSGLNSIIKRAVAENKMSLQKASSVRLSEYIKEEVDMLKIDTEGAEDLILSDLVSSGKIGLIKNISLEYHQKLCQTFKNISDMADFLGKNGFSCSYFIHGDNYLVSACKQ